jgi:hypothetical protein
MKIRIIAAIAALLAVPVMAGAQSHRPYAGLDKRSVKALSDQQISDLEAGRGMGLALAAELNGYPGPLHVLELAEPLGLTPAQRDETRALFAAMKAEAVALGARIIAAESDLDRRFASGAITESTLVDGVREIAALQGELRAAHLKYHLAVARLLTSQQVAHYAELRGYRKEAPPSHQHGKH